MRIERSAQTAAEVAPERVEPDFFPGQGVGSVHVQLAAALGLSDVGPVGGPVAGVDGHRVQPEHAGRRGTRPARPAADRRRRPPGRATGPVGLTPSRAALHGSQVVTRSQDRHTGNRGSVVRAEVCAVAGDQMGRSGGRGRREQHVRIEKRSVCHSGGGGDGLEARQALGRPCGTWPGARPIGHRLLGGGA